MKITIVTVCYNVETEIEKTILSVINQTYPNIEYIIIDGGSTDGTKSIIKKYEKHIAKWISEKDDGIYDAMNKGISLATGEYINFMNAGDIFASNDIIESLIPYLDDGTDVVYGDSESLESNGKINFHKGGIDLSLLRFHPIYRHNAAFVKTAVHKEIPFDLSKAKDFKYALDYNNIFHLWRFGKSFKHIEKTIVRYLKEGTSSNTLKSITLNFKISHQYESPSIIDYLKHYTSIAKIAVRHFFASL